MNTALTRLVNEVKHFVELDLGQQAVAIENEADDGHSVDLTYATPTGKIVATLAIGESTGAKYGQVVEHWNGFTFTSPCWQANVAARIGSEVADRIAKLVGTRPA